MTTTSRTRRILGTAAVAAVALGTFGVGAANASTPVVAKTKVVTKAKPKAKVKHKAKAKTMTTMAKTATPTTLKK